MRVVIDTNVIVSALLLDGSTSREAFDKALGSGKILLSFPVLNELNEVLSREKFSKYLDHKNRKRFLAVFVRHVEWVEITEKIAICRDPKDNMFLELAVSGQASYIITGDKDLISLNPFRDILILTPVEFLCID